MKGKRLRLLSIDGGGIRGIVPATILTYIEHSTKTPICELFDAIAGTSTGGILALGLAAPEAQPGERQGRAQALLELYRSQGATIFHRTRIDKTIQFPGAFEQFGLPAGFDLNDLWRPRYKPDGRRNVLEQTLKQAHLTEALLPVFIPSYDTELRCPVFFVSDPAFAEADAAAHAEDRERYYELTADATMLNAAMATSAAPTYFPPHPVARPQGRPYSLIDGGVFANNPTELAYSFLQGGDHSGDCVLSLGTGSMQHAYRFEAVEGWGTLAWAAPVLKMTFDGQTEAVSVAMRRRFEKAGYLRLQGMLEDAGASDDLDDVGEANMKKLEALAHRILEENKDAIDAFCQRLMA